MKVHCVVISCESVGHAMKITERLNVGLHGQMPLLFSKCLAVLRALRAKVFV